ncbi:hypothetical protein HZF08_16850 [Paenibacillus sp. CGMCC 1.16610]|uniref:Uncharacterized protein n=1 Tax=Paenibacillus anseongense TaxID=2682845 RepID=A0ABW9UFK1_9BACL|nr:MULTISPECIES: hypothetical protein [Paenibacillus]MBA2939982.1 hypothetical protein [Paenibacillus sp. CGMCC 1.16610]MVQ38937.1 hypothetical protein [Paenibacillus anseongense]
MIDKAESTNEYINITCIIPSYRHSTGGNLYINADELILYDVNDNELSVNHLRETAKDYWERFSNGN